MAEIGRWRKAPNPWPATLLRSSTMDSANKEEALKALNMARKYLSSTPPNIATSKRLALKSVALCETSEAMNFLERVRALEEEIRDTNSSSNGGSGATANGSASANGNAHTTGTEPFAGTDGMKHRHSHSSTTPSGKSTPKASTAAAGASKGKGKDDEKREYTAEQLAVVKRIRKCKVTQYYEILSLQKDCEEADVKKAYRKVWCCASLLPCVC
jgi:DnaJ homolog subfamily B member 12